MSSRSGAASIMLRHLGSQCAVGRPLAIAQIRLLHQNSNSGDGAIASDASVSTCSMLEAVTRTGPPPFRVRASSSRAQHWVLFVRTLAPMISVQIDASAGNSIQN